MVLARGDAEPAEVQIRVLRLQRIEGPVHDVDAEPEQLVALESLEPRADAAVAELGADGEHVRPVDEPAGLDPGQSEDEADHAAIGVEGAGGHAAHLLRRPEDGRRDQLAEVLAPDGFLERHAQLRLLDRA